MLDKVAYVTLFVNDHDKALDFYTKTLGFQKRADNPTPEGTRFLTVGLEGDPLQLVLWPGARGKAKEAPGRVPGACIIETADCRKAFEILESRGARFEAPGVVELPFALSATLHDPDGNRIMLRESRPVKA